MLQFVDKTFNQVAFAVQMPINARAALCGLLLME